MRQFKDKVICITGVGSGIGRALAIKLNAAGVKLALNDNNVSGLEETISMLPNQDLSHIAEVFDVSDRESVYAFSEKVLQRFGQVDGCINNAGVALGTVSVDRLSYEDFDWIFGINFWGMVYGTKAYLPMIKQQTEGFIANVSSIFGIAGIAYQTAYCTTKFAIRGFNESLRMEMHVEAPHVKIHSIHPGGIKTNIAKDSKVAIGMEEQMAKQNDEKLADIEKAFITSPGKAADIIISGINRKKERIMIGSDAKKVDRLVRLFPEKYTGMLLKNSDMAKLRVDEEV